MGMVCRAFSVRFSLDVVRREQFLQHHHLVADLAEADQEIAVRRGGVDLVAEFDQGGSRRLEPFRRGEGQQGRLVRGADEIKSVGHKLI